MKTASAAVPSAPPAPRHPLTLPHFRNLWVGSTISLLGDQFFLVALPWLVLQLTGSSLVLGTMMMAAAIPRTVLMLVGGAVTDRVSPRRVLMTTAATRAVLVGIVAALVWFKVVELWHIFVLTLAFGIADAFGIPAGAALIPTLVAPQQLRPANALFQSSTVLTQMAGPAPAGLIIKRWGIAPALLFDALSFLAVIGALFRVPNPPSPPAPVAGAAPRPSMVHSIAEGLRAVRNDPALLSLMVVFASINVCVAGPVGVGLAAMTKFQFQSAAAFGTLLSCFSGGTLAGILLGGMVKHPRRRGLQFIVASSLAGFELIGIGLFPKLAVIGTMLALMGFGIGFVNVQFSAWIQMRVERALLGRVASVLMVCAVGLVPVSYAVSGALAQWSFKGLFIGAGTLLATISIAMALSSRAAREID
ncbi:MAG: MFS transporter [Acidobacteria bacterium]|nr:MFS transporter [Acidobacteriota bacterium]